MTIRRPYGTVCQLCDHPGALHRSPAPETAPFACAVTGCECQASASDQLPLTKAAFLSRWPDWPASLERLFGGPSQ